MLSKRSVTSFLLSGTLLMSIGANVQAQDIEDFKARMSTAKDLAKTDMSEALRVYLETRVQYAGPEIDYSLGRSYQRMYQCSEAQNFYTQVMVNYDLDPENPIYSRAVSDYDTIADCESWQKVTISCTKSSKDYISIDDQKMSECWDRPYSLPDGEHTIKLIRAEDGNEITVKFTAKSGAPDKHIDLAFPVPKAEDFLPTQEQCATMFPTTKVVEYKERFSPWLYWGLMSGGLVFLAGAGGFGAWANNALVDVQKYEDIYVVNNDNNAKSKADDARDTVKLANTLMYTSIGIGGALVASGITLAILSAISPKTEIESVEQNNVTAFISPDKNGFTLGMELRF